jgi:hypothetical protein
VSLHPQEALLQEARAFQRSAAFAPYRRLRQAAEHRDPKGAPRLMQLGMRQARYVGRAKTLGQLILAATVANLTLVARRIGLMPHRSQAHGQSALPALAWLLIALTALNLVGTSALTSGHVPRFSMAGFRPDF